MQIIVNGENREFNDEITLQEVITTLQIEDKVMAAAVNMQIVKKEKWESFRLSNEDKLELLQFVGGG
ncbi:sulfur carrier protein ThiS [Malaciobacter mytili]|uniref:Thiamine biosynthesis protein ThiS n=1 Tax=Malaciobacter mytili LMG 24559 TaxID=1032238 RepID=A0AAX2AG20_9BACT|nr:sulfur carrier protein ThiS [Malaciobacter mytili]AXH15955.1 thiamine biosynthesis protein [Malaciobacter mytili LMG 24559]RXK15969.1 thiamine biosynthesis protein ThiS [Malaciobacter mytili LMG 24559]